MLGLQAKLLYGVLPELDVITRSVKLFNGGGGRLYIEKASSAVLDFIYGDYDLMTFYGRHALERNVQKPRWIMDGSVWEAKEEPQAISIIRQ